MSKKAAALVCFLLIMVSAFALDVKPEVRKDLSLGFSIASRTNNLSSLFHASEQYVTFRTPVGSLLLGLGASAGKAESFYNFSTFTGTGDFRTLGVHVLADMKYRRIELEACAGLCALFRGSLSSGFRTLVRTSLCPVIGLGKTGSLGFSLGFPVTFAFNASESMLSAGVGIRAFPLWEDER